MVLLLVPVALIALGYRSVASALGRQAAGGLLLMAAGVGAAVWLLDNFTW
jgi:hypothetical protein